MTRSNKTLSKDAAFINRAIMPQVAQYNAHQHAPGLNQANYTSDNEVSASMKEDGIYEDRKIPYGHIRNAVPSERFLLMESGYGWGT